MADSGGRLNVRPAGSPAGRKSTLGDQERYARRRPVSTKKRRPDFWGPGRLAYEADLPGGAVPEVGQEEGAEVGASRSLPQHLSDRLPHPPAASRLQRVGRRLLRPAAYRKNPAEPDPEAGKARVESDGRAAGRSGLAPTLNFHSRTAYFTLRASSLRRRKSVKRGSSLSGSMSGSYLSSATPEPLKAPFSNHSNARSLSPRWA